MSSPATSPPLSGLRDGAVWVAIVITLLPQVATIQKAAGQETAKESPSKQAPSEAAGDARRWLSSVQDVLAGAIERNQRSVVSIARIKKRVMAVPTAPYDRSGALDAHPWR